MNAELRAAAMRQLLAAKNGYWTVYKTRYEAIHHCTADRNLLAQAWLAEHSKEINNHGNQIDPCELGTEEGRRTEAN